MNKAETDQFYAESMRILHQSKIPFLVGGTCALNLYTGIDRPTKDIDVLATAGNHLKIIALFRQRGYATEMVDARWLARITKDDAYIDIIFSSAYSLVPVTEEWFENPTPMIFYDIPIFLPSPTFLILSKLFVQSRIKYDGPDIAHLILTQSDRIDWHFLLSHLEPFWEVLLGQIVSFRFIYPSEHGKIPKWLMDELVRRLTEQMELPPPHDKICRGKLLSREDYKVDTEKFGFIDIAG